LAQSGPLEKLAGTADFGLFQAELIATLGPRDRAKGGGIALLDEQRRNA
jgi:hypothetical protein